MAMECSAEQPRVGLAGDAVRIACSDEDPPAVESKTWCYRPVLVGVAVVVAFVGGCAALFAASVAAEVEEDSEVASLVGGLRHPDGSVLESAITRRASSNSTGPDVPMAFRPAETCHTATTGEPCFRHVIWAMTHGIHEKPHWYPGLSPSSSFGEFQAFLASRDLHAECPRPCGVTMPTPAPAPSCEPASVRRRRRHATMCSCRRRHGGAHLDQGMTCQGNTVVPFVPGSKVGTGYWCEAAVPEATWRLQSCIGASRPTMRVKALTYNLFWWNLFGRRGGNGGSAGRLMREAARAGHFDVMGFQEADHIRRPLEDAGFSEDDYSTESALGMAIAWRKPIWEKLSSGIDRIAEDRPGAYYGRRGVMWVRLRNHASNRTLVFANHHGPLPVGSGGVCGGEATAYNILSLLEREARDGDAIILTGDFNAAAHHATVETLEGRLHRLFTGTSFGGVDHFFSNCNNSMVVETRNLGAGGSDHDALMVVLDL